MGWWILVYPSQSRSLFSDYIARHQQLCCCWWRAILSLKCKTKKTVHYFCPNGVSTSNHGLIMGLLHGKGVFLHHGISLFPPFRPKNNPRTWFTTFACQCCLLVLPQYSSMCAPGKSIFNMGNDLNLCGESFSDMSYMIYAWESPANGKKFRIVPGSFINCVL